MKPCISVVIPTFNRGVAIEATMESALHQDGCDDCTEIIVVDDGSTDDTWEFLNIYYGQHARVRLFRTANGGVARARNFGLQQAQGEWIAFLDHDDEWAPSKLSAQWERARQNLSCGVVYCAWSRIESGRVVEDGVERLRSGAVTWPQGQVFDALLRHNFIVSMSVPLIRTNLLRQIGGFDPQVVPADDWDVWLRLSRRCEFAFVPESLVFYHQHETQQSADGRQIMEARARVFAKHRLHLLSRPRALWGYVSAAYFFQTVDPFYNEARAALAASDWRGTRHIITRALRHFPFLWLTPQWLYVFVRLARRDARSF